MDNRDQRDDSGMGDSTVMTVEFLRARLLSERSVSKTARQRADELAKRVSELEEQLRIVSLQRTKAEKATEAVLAILEGNGISDVSETYDSSSDQDPPYESKQDTFVNSEEFSSSDFDFSSIPKKSLSWKGCKETSRSLERYRQSSLRRRSTFAAAASSSKNQPGKSCRKIRYKESRSIAEELKANPVDVDSVEVDVDKKLENSPDLLGNDQIDKYNNGYGGDRGMEEALEHQAKLIGQYEAMEKAQREWEEKFRENNNSTPDSCDPGNRSDVTEETYELKASVESPAVISNTQTHDTRSKVAVESLALISRTVQSSNGSFRKEEQTSINPNENNSIVPHRESEGLGNVLDALKDARQSLQQRINNLPFSATPQPLDRARISSDQVQIPVGCVGLFRLPTDFSSQGRDFQNLNSQLSLGNYDGSRVSNKKRYFDRYVDTGLPPSSKYSYPTYPINTSYPDMMPRMGGPSSNFGSASSQSQLSFMDDKIGRNSYR